MTTEPTIRDRIRELAARTVTELPTPEQTRAAEQKAANQKRVAANGRAAQGKASYHASYIRRRHP